MLDELPTPAPSGPLARMRYSIAAARAELQLARAELCAALAEHTDRGPSLSLAAHMLRDADATLGTVGVIIEPRNQQKRPATARTAREAYTDTTRAPFAQPEAVSVALRANGGVGAEEKTR